MRDRLLSTFEGDEVEIRADVFSGAAHCWLIGDCAAITRREGTELVVVCLAGSDLLKAGLVIIEAARAAGCKTLRFHTKREALGRLLRPLGFSLDQYVFRACIDGQ